MRFIPLLSGQTGRRLFYRRTCGVDFGWDTSCRIDTNASSYWSARTAAHSSHPEVLPSCWPLSVTRGRRSIIHQRLSISPSGESHIVQRQRLSLPLNRSRFTNTGSKVQQGTWRRFRLRRFVLPLFKTATSLSKADQVWGSDLVYMVNWKSCETLNGNLLNETIRRRIY